MVRFDDDFVDHPKVADLTDSAFRLHVAAICWSARTLTDGHISVRFVSASGATKRPKRVAASLVAAGLWEPCEDGWRIHDYADYQPTRDKVRKTRAAAKARQTNWRNRVRNASRNAVSSSTPPPKEGGKRVGGRSTAAPPDAYTSSRDPASVMREADMRRRTDPCPTCHGDRLIEDQHGDFDQCPACHGTGAQTW